MVPLLLALVLVPPGSMAESKMDSLDPPQGPTAVTGMIMIPPKVPECTDRYQAQRAAEEQIKGFDPECILPRKSKTKPQQH